MGWRVGRNPPSVLGGIHLIGIPAPPAEFIGAYYPFHGVGGHFTLTASLLNASASSSAASGGFFLCPDPTSQPAPHDATRPPRGWSFLRPIGFRARSRSPTRQPNRLAAGRDRQGLRKEKKLGGGVEVYLDRIARTYPMPPSVKPITARRINAVIGYS